LYGIDGDVGIYFPLIDALGDDQPIIALRSPALQDGAKLPDTMEEAATEALGWIRRLQPDGSMAILGYSWSGLLAFEMARQAARAGGEAGFTALVGTAAPMRPTNVARRTAHAMTHFPAWFWHLMRDPSRRRERLLRWREMAQSARNHISKAGVPEAGWASSPISRRMIKLMEEYRPTRSNLELDLFRERNSGRAHPLRAWQTSHLADGGWSSWLGQRHRVHSVDGDHWNMIKPPAVAGLAQAIRQAMDRHFAIGSRRSFSGTAPLNADGPGIFQSRH
jgi:thioesterase domain-containing protein